MKHTIRLAVIILVLIVVFYLLIFVRDNGMHIAGFAIAGLQLLLVLVLFFRNFTRADNFTAVVQTSQRTLVGGTADSSTYETTTITFKETGEKHTVRHDPLCAFPLIIGYAAMCVLTLWVWEYWRTDAIKFIVIGGCVTAVGTAIVLAITVPWSHNMARRRFVSKTKGEAYDLVKDIVALKNDPSNYTDRHLYPADPKEYSWTIEDALDDALEEFKDKYNL